MRLIDQMITEALPDEAQVVCCVGMAAVAGWVVLINWQIGLVMFPLVIWAWSAHRRSRAARNRDHP